ncbi:hypothetical protein GDO81_019161 [Engystomops pustulosus]|uniref:G-protein coupled receptors family 1 profile domain-containing protein n=1 Tax=Engystomops pustulosus TaxID=76066 RepID=A0AAV6Z9Z6_ENGPU|nr:hypothetical protein GDO81_019161 [Engystomops pustulosus]
MENFTYNFFILTFSTYSKNPSTSSTFFVLLYLIGVIANSTTITVICRDPHLHTPMYLFLCNLSFVDLCYMTSTVPKLVHMLLSDNYTISFSQCFTQMYFFGQMATTEDLLLFNMAYDRYVAICNPLNYHNVLSKKNCIMFLVVAWLAGCITSITSMLMASNIPLFSNRVPQFLCDFKAFTKMSCPVAGFLLFTSIGIVIFGFGPFLFCIISYTRVIVVILHIKSSDGRKKAFSTCSSHIIILTMYYGTWLAMYLTPPLRDPNLSQVFNLALSILFAIITPMVNPLIYSVRNKDVKRAILKLFGYKVNEED